MTIWKNPGWFDEKKRKMQLDDHVNQTGRTRYGLMQMPVSDKNAVVADHFTRVARKYDFMNTLLSFGLHYQWKRSAIRMLGLKSGDRVLDVAGGTGDMSVLARRIVGPKGLVVLYDLNRAMMDAGREKRRQRDPVRYVQGNGESISFPENSFDAVIVSFGIRNFTHLIQGFKEMYRVVKPGGKMICLEFSRPQNPVFCFLYDFYSFNIMPLAGKIFTGSSQAYACLPETIRMFPLSEELIKILTDIGFTDIICRKMTNGIALAHIGKKPTQQP